MYMYATVPDAPAPGVNISLFKQRDRQPDRLEAKGFLRDRGVIYAHYSVTTLVNPNKSKDPAARWKFYGHKQLELTIFWNWILQLKSCILRKTEFDDACRAVDAWSGNCLRQ